LSARAPLHVFGASFDIPGCLVWAAPIYAAIGTTLTHLIGRKLIPLNFQQQRFEADFRLAAAAAALFPGGHARSPPR
jgi:vitamin B12/bleomycin/antimicrobial peptide transport system ATP-binding/permease protein